MCTEFNRIGCISLQRFIFFLFAFPIYFSIYRSLVCFLFRTFQMTNSICECASKVYNERFCIENLIDLCEFIWYLIFVIFDFGFLLFSSSIFFFVVILHTHSETHMLNTIQYG